MSNSHTEQPSPVTRDAARSEVRRGKVLRWAGTLALLAVLALAFMGHLSADMQLQWENLMALCGF